MTIERSPALSTTTLARLYLAFMLGTWSASLAAGSAPPEIPPERQRQIRSRIEAFLAEQQVPALSLAIISDNKIAFGTGFGTLNPEGSHTAGVQTLYRLASVSKPMTAVAVMQLAERGRLDLDRPARDYCSAYPKKSADPTVRHLLAHQSGIPHSTDAEDTTIKGAYPRSAAAVPHYADKPLRFKPGQETLYTSWGYALLGCVIEGASGRSYGDYLAENVLGPASMSATQTDRPDFESPDFAPGFRPGFFGRGWRPSVVVDTRFKTPAAGLISSAADLARFLIAMTDGTLLSPETLQLMLTPQAPSEGAGNFALGWIIGRERPQGQGYYHTGSMEGATALIYFTPSRRFGLVVLTNRERFVDGIVPLIGPLISIVLEE